MPILLYRKLDEIREQNAELIQSRRVDAQEAIELMKDSVARKVESELSRDGIIIISALYGKLPPSLSARILSLQGMKNMTDNINRHISSIINSELNLPQHESSFIDVTIPVQSLVQNGQLHISGGHSKSNMIGFWDPCLGEKKQLDIVYQFQGKLHHVQVDDKAAVAAPLRGNI